MSASAPVMPDPRRDLDLERFLRAPDRELSRLAKQSATRSSLLARWHGARWDGRPLVAASALLALAAIVTLAIASLRHSPAILQPRPAISQPHMSPTRALDSRPGLPTKTLAPAKASRVATARGDAMLRLLGQHIMGSWRGSTSIPPEVLSDIETGRIGGVVLFADDVPAPTAAAYRALADRLRAAARAGGNPPLLIAVDQEGGQVRRLAGAPFEDASQIGGDWSASFNAAGDTAALLRAAHINVDLAPVSDVPKVSGAFIGQRAFSSSPAQASGAVSAFVLGLQSDHVAATAKHFPGLGRATVSTDLQPVHISASKQQLEAEMAPFRAALASGVRMVMVSSAVYAALDPWVPAVLSQRIVTRLRHMGFNGVLISDAIDAPPLARYGGRASLRALRAGVDMVLYADSDGAGSYRTLAAALRAGQLDPNALATSTDRILALKRWLR